MSKNGENCKVSVKPASSRKHDICPQDSSNPARMMLGRSSIMSPSTIPWKLLSSNIGVGILTDGWNLADPGPEPVRTFFVDVWFSTPFSVPPAVHLGLTGFDADQRDSQRISLRMTAVNEFGVRAAVSTWASSRVYSVEFNWLAIGA